MIVTQADLAQVPVVFVCVASAGIFAAVLWYRLRGTHSHEEDSAAEPEPLQPEQIP